VIDVHCHYFAERYMELIPASPCRGCSCTKRSSPSSSSSMPSAIYGGTADGLGARARWYGDPDAAVARQSPDLLVVDEADRLKTASLEQLRDFYDRRHVGVVLIGMPGLQKRLARYAQLSRVGFAHQFQPLSGRELQNVIEQQ